MNYKLIAMDFDGTLLNDKKEVTEKTKNALIKCKKKGYTIVGVTARALYSAKSVVPLNLFDYLILNNGSYIYDVKKEKGICIGLLDKDTVLEITNIVSDFSNKIDFISSTTYYAYKYNKNSNVSFIKNVNNIEEISEEIVRMNIFLAEQSNIDKQKDMLNNLYNSIHCFVMQDSGNSEKWLVINPKGIDKKITLEKLGKKLNIKLNEMIFFGDGLNDLPVIGAVGCSVAMGNALDEVKNRCKYITLSNNDDGIAVILKEKILNIKK